MRTRRFLALTAFVALAAAPGAAAADLAQVRALSTPAPPGSAEPNLAVRGDGSVILSWTERLGEAGHALRFAVRPPGGEWSAPREVARGQGWFVNWADFPSLAAHPDGSLVAHWLVKSGAGKYAYDVQLARSADGGATWSAPQTPHRDGTASEHGFVSLLPWDGGTGVLWLDGRDLGKPGGATALRFTTAAPDGTLGPEQALDSRVCDCCQTAAARAGDALVVAYRDRSPEEVRDISVVRFAEGAWSAPAPVSGDRWKIDGCPVNGPALAARGGRVVLAWFAAPAEKARVRLAFSKDAGRSFAAPIELDAERPLGRVDVALLEGGDALASWLGRRGDAVVVLARRVSERGPVGEELVVTQTTGERASGFPRMKLAGAEVVFAWTEPGDPPRVRTAVVAAPR